MRDGGIGTPARSMDTRSPFKSKLERSYADYLHTLMVCGDIRLYRYEPQTFNLAPGVRYTPDFWVRLKDGKEEWHEVKGYAKSLLFRAGMVKVKIAVSQWPWMKFVLVTRRRGIWNQQEL